MRKKGHEIGSRNVFKDLGLPNADVTSPQAGQITSLANNSSMRRLQFSGRIDF